MIRIATLTSGKEALMSETYWETKETLCYRAEMDGMLFYYQTFPTGAIYQVSKETYDEIVVKHINQKYLIECLND